MSLPAACPDDGTAGTELAPDASPCVSGVAGPAAAPAAVPAPAAAPLVDPAALQDLGAQLDSPAVAEGFARDYAKLWDRRYRSLASALERRDQAGSLDAVLSLKTSSAMVGGVRLAQLAGEVEDAIRAGDMDGARSLLCDVAERGGETVDELQFSYVVWES
ncbi:Hpt domain-containing protein [Pseudarthrobacter sp. S9]|uniref:Hpt domain-containing protein n=1 Tax=Pseudarthrobacter sp. S9 TaxID=3418421 RepID=UPI003D01BAC3